MRRGNKRKKEKSIFTIMGTNAAGLSNKNESFLDTIKDLKPQVIMVQETKFNRKTKLKLPGYQVFERVNAPLWTSTPDPGSFRRRREASRNSPPRSRLQREIDRVFERIINEWTSTKFSHRSRPKQTFVNLRLWNFLFQMIPY